MWRVSRSKRIKWGISDSGKIIVANLIYLTEDRTWIGHQLWVRCERKVVCDTKLSDIPHLNFETGLFY